MTRKARSLEMEARIQEENGKGEKEGPRSSEEEGRSSPWVERVGRLFVHHDELPRLRKFQHWVLSARGSMVKARTTHKLLLWLTIFNLCIAIVVCILDVMTMARLSLVV